MTSPMTSRQRVRAALDHQQPDRVPADLGGTIVTTLHAGAYNRLKLYLGIDTPPLPGSGPSKKIVVEHQVLEALQIDTRYICTKGPDNSRERIGPNGYYRNEWGVEYQLPDEEEYSYTPQGAPLQNATIADIDSYPWPDPLDPGRTRGLAEQAKAVHDQGQYALVGNVDKPSIFELALAMRGFEAFLTDMAGDPDFAQRLLEKITQLQVLRYEQFLESVGPYLDVIVFADDVGMQHGLLISPDNYRQFLKSLHEKLYDAIRRKTDAKIFYHTCGDCYALIPDFIEIGIDILNPIQVSASNMQTDRLKREFGKDLVFWGAVDTQHVLPHGAPADVACEVRQRIDDLGQNGGFVIAPVHNIVDDVPPENIAAMFQYDTMTQTK